MGAAMPLASNIPLVRAASAGGDVVVACPDLAEATSAELEARARATLLTSDLAATVAISCVGEGAVVVQVAAGGDSVTLQLRVVAATLREEVLRALDRALADLGARVTTASRAAVESSTSSAAPTTASAPGGSQPEREASEAEEPSAPAPGRDSSSAPGRGTELELGVSFIGEKWGSEPALGGGLRAALHFDSTWSCGVRAGALHPLTFGEATVIEAHALLEATVTAHGLAGLRFGLGAGPSLLFVSPASGLVAPGSTMKSALRIEAQIARPFRWHRAELTPWVGARTFSAERGVRVTQTARLVVGGIEPQAGLALSLLH